MNPIRRAVTGARRLRTLVLAALVLFAASALPRIASADAGTPAAATIRVVNDATGSRLQVDGRDFMMKGMNWDYIPIGQNYAFDLFSQPD